MPRQLGLVITARIRSQFLDRAKFKAMFSEANQIALTKAGVRIRDAAKKGIGNAAPHKPKRISRKVQLAGLDEFDGGLYKDLTRNSGGGKPRPPGKPVKSWAPRRWIYRDIKYYWDPGGQAVVIGPYRTPWLNRLHEFGGSERLVGWVIGERIARRAKAIQDRGGRIPRRADGGLETGYIRWVAPGFGFKGQKVKGFVRSWTKTGTTKTVRYPARPFMQGSEYVKKALTKISRDFQDTLNVTSQGGVNAGGPTVTRIAG